MMNLVNDPWIPVMLPDGRSDMVGLTDLFQRADAIRDLAVDPPQRVALMRLLICKRSSSTKQETRQAKAAT